MEEYNREYDILDESEKSIVIRLGLIAYREIQNTIVREKLGEIGEKNRKEIRGLQEELTVLRDDISTKSKIISDLTSNQHSILEAERTAISSRIRREYEDMLGRLTGECSDLKKEIQRFPSSIIDAETRTARQYDIIIQMLRDQLAAAEERTRRDTNSSLRGQDGEKADSQMLHEAFPEAVIRSVGRTGHMGDFIIEFDGGSILWDSKNYTGAVAKRERDKIIADVDANPVSGGIMASSFSLIQGRKNMEIELTPGGKPVIYLARLRENDQNIIDTVRSSKNVIMSCLKYFSGDQSVELLRAIHILNDRAVSLRRQLDPLRIAAKSINESIANLNGEIDEISGIIRTTIISRDRPTENITAKYRESPEEMMGEVADATPADDVVILTPTKNKRKTGGTSAAKKKMN